MTKKREFSRNAADLDTELQEYLRELEQRDPVILTPRVSGEIKSVAAMTYEHVISSISAVKPESIRPIENSDRELALIMDLTLDFENTYGEAAAKLLASVRDYYEQNGKLVLAHLTLVIDILKEFFGKFSIKDREKVVRIVLALKPKNYTVLEFNQLLSNVADWVRATKPILVDVFIGKEITYLERKSISQEGEGVTMEDHQYLIDLLREFTDVSKKYSYEVSNQYMKIYFDEGDIAANRFLKLQ